jgi:hypothetical protein
MRSVASHVPGVSQSSGVPELYVFFIVNDTDRIITILDMCVCQDVLDS